MPLFDKIGEKIAQTGQSAMQRTKNVTDAVKLKGLISEEEKRIANAYQHIGSTYHQAYGHAPDPLFAQSINEINAAKEKIASYAEQMKQIRGVVNCTKCGGEVPHDAAFCNSCGSPINSAPGAVEDGVLCGECGTMVSSEMAFCVGCGSRMGKAAAAPPPFAQTAPPAAPPKRQCSGCEAELLANTVFCLNCGHKIDS